MCCDQSSLGFWVGQCHMQLTGVDIKHNYMTEKQEKKKCKTTLHSAGISNVEAILWDYKERKIICLPTMVILYWHL